MQRMSGLYELCHSGDGEVIKERNMEPFKFISIHKYDLLDCMDQVYK